MTLRRVRKPGIETTVLFRNRFTCCICHNDTKEVLVHHIDGNPGNTKEQNLAVLCLEHASKADIGLKTGKGGAGRKLSPQLVESFKQRWEERVASEFQVQRKTLPSTKRKQLELLYEFEMNKLKYELISAGPGETQFIERKIRFMAESLGEEFRLGLRLRGVVLDAFLYIAKGSWVREDVIIPLIHAVESLHLHLFQREIRMTAEDKKALTKSLEVLEAISFNAAGFAPNTRILELSCATIGELAWIARKHRFTSFLDSAKKTISVVLAACLTYTGLNPLVPASQIKESLRKRDSIVSRTKKYVDNL